MRVLLVDDETELVSALAERLQLRGIQADWYTSAEAALERAAGEAYDLAVLDMKMPKIGGFELKQRLQAIRPGMQFIFMTGYGSEADFAKVTCQPDQPCYLVKPVDIQVLIARMHEMLGTGGGDA